ncbi:AraC family transcriptional regulator [Paenibacillus yonginensis]|uniref:AraC family transcriptional regulator n=1 Tax=Paenibacillus yonginensis TaxID=1462996 RepID=A0A1B1N1W2_9BACL|nr:AraC family transcriptional regulator [Paenibacillus yonginensis]ANS75420.1 AraC family transcriptional regulator [Paenibacillus yonginensis]
MNQPLKQTVKPATYMSAANPDFPGYDVLRVLFAGESQTSPSHRLGPKIYDFYLFHYIEEGSGVFRTEKGTYRLRSGSGFMIEPDHLVSYESDPETPWRYRWLAFSGAGAKELAREAGFSQDTPVVHGSSYGPIPEALGSILAAFREQQEGAGLAALGYLYLIMAEAKRSLVSGTANTEGEAHIQRVVKQMIHYMTSQYAYPISIEEMCSGLGYNRAYLSRVFKKGTGMSPVTYLLKLRIDKARYLLRDRPDLSIEQIAASVGLTDPLYFSRQFKRFYGEAPSTYRRSVTRG